MRLFFILSACALMFCLNAFAMREVQPCAYQQSPTVCNSCRGSGKIASQKCIHCDGRGLISPNRSNPHGQKANLCNSCRGSGKIATQKCINCDGRGILRPGQSTGSRTESPLECHSCRGTGRLGSQKCVRCNGRGLLRANGSAIY